MKKENLNIAAQKIGEAVAAGKHGDKTPIGNIKDVAEWLSKEFGLNPETTSEARSMIGALNARGASYAGGPGRHPSLDPNHQFQIVDFGGWQNVRSEEVDAEPQWHVLPITEAKKRRLAELRETSLIIAKRLKEETEGILGLDCDATLDPTNLDVTLRTASVELQKFAKVELSAAQHMSENAEIAYLKNDASKLIAASSKPLKRLQAMAKELDGL